MTALVAIAACGVCAERALAAWPWAIRIPERRPIKVRHPSQLPQYSLRDTPERPATVIDRREDAPSLDVSLDEAIRTALSNTEVVRVLAGVTAVSSGRTIYDAAITNTTIDQQWATFDPTLAIDNTWNRFEPPVAFFDPMDPTRTRIGGTATDNYDIFFDLSKQLTTGGTLRLTADDSTSHFHPGIFPLNPQNRTALDLTLTQPLLQGGGRAANLAPVVLARIDTERSFFQLKDGVQSMVLSVIDAYWGLVFARTDLWAREQQVEQAEFAYRQAEVRARVGEISGGEVAQPRLSLANFRASLVTARANLLQQEAALRNIMGLAPYDAERLTPMTPPSEERLLVDWAQVVGLAEQYRPDLIELKLILEADQQSLIQARNQALPRVDAVALYRWNGLEGVMPVGDRISSSLGESTEWTLAVNFSVPLGLRRERAQLRQQELLIARDRANLDQGLDATVQILAESVRNLDQFYEQYIAFRETRQAARENLELQMGRYSAGITEYLNVLQAIVDWGNAVSSEAQSLTQYNTERARLALETGTILETHGVRFYEERFGSIGPLGYLCPDWTYPGSQPPSGNTDVYPSGDRPAEESFNLEDPLEGLERIRQRGLDLPDLSDPRYQELPPLPPIPSAPEGLRLLPAPQGPQVPDLSAPSAIQFVPPVLPQ